MKISKLNTGLAVLSTIIIVVLSSIIIWGKTWRPNRFDMSEMITQKQAVSIIQSSHDIGCLSFRPETLKNEDFIFKKVPFLKPS
jgi:hypothetical protein